MKRPVRKDGSILVLEVDALPLECASAIAAVIMPIVSIATERI